MLLSGVPAKNVGMIVDLWDLHVAGGSLEGVRKLGGERLIAVRLADAPADVVPADLKLTQRMVPGDGGAIDAAAALVTLAEMGFDGLSRLRPIPSSLRACGARRR